MQNKKPWWLNESKANYLSNIQMFDGSHGAGQPSRRSQLAAHQVFHAAAPAATDPKLLMSSSQLQHVPRCVLILQTDE